MSPEPRYFDYNLILLVSLNASWLSESHPAACHFLIIGTTSLVGVMWRNDSIRGHCLLADRQRNGGAEHVVGIIVPLGFGEPFGIATIAFQHTVCVAQPSR